MIFPLEQLVEFNSNIYEITVAASRRAYQMAKINDPEIEANSDKIIESRVITVRELVVGTEEADITDLTVDHLARFVECCKNNIDNSAILEAELAEICK